MENSAHSLTRELGHPVEDRTGLSGVFDFQVEFTPDDGPCTTNAPDRPTLAAALQEQLGLKLESMRGPVGILVVDRAEKPADN